MKNSTNVLSELIKCLGLKAIQEHFQSLAEEAERDGMSYVDYLKQLLQLEFERRHQARIERLQKQAKIPRNKLLREFEIARVEGLSHSMLNALAEGEFIDRCENVLIFGEPGAGKTHIAIALAREWCLHGRKVLYTTTAALVQELMVAKKALALNALIKKLDRYEVLVIDDISYVPYDREEADVLFVLLSDRYEQRSIVITSNLAFSKWDKVFKDEMTTAAAIDRLVHHATILELKVVESYRAAQAKAKAKARQALARAQKTELLKEVTKDKI